MPYPRPPKAFAIAWHDAVVSPPRFPTQRTSAVPCVGTIESWTQHSMLRTTQQYAGSRRASSRSSCTRRKRRRIPRSSASTPSGTNSARPRTSGSSSRNRRTQISSITGSDDDVGGWYDYRLVRGWLHRHDSHHPCINSVAAQRPPVVKDQLPVMVIWPFRMGAGRVPTMSCRGSIVPC